MEDKDFKREDYVYLRIANDFEIKDRNGWSSKDIKYDKGTILRFKKQWLIKAIASRQLGYAFSQYGIDGLKYDDNPDCDEDDILYDKLYSSITVAKDRSCRLVLWPREIFYINDWLQGHLNSRSFRDLLAFSEKALNDGDVASNLIELGDRTVEVYINFKEGEVLDFTNPAVMMLFYDMDWLKILANSELIIGEEKEQLFNGDFSNAIWAQDESKSKIYGVDSMHDLDEFHYFILNDDIKIKDEKSEKVLIDGKEVNLPWAVGLYYDMDENGYLRVAHIRTWGDDNSNRDIEQYLLKFARRATREEAREYHDKRIAAYLKKSAEKDEQIHKEWIEEARILSEAYNHNKHNPNYFPGANGDFVHVLDDKAKEVKQPKYSLQQIKEFYQNLNRLNSDIVKEMCFYGGTIPYILTNAEESREFGDIDVFIPVSMMERLREELSRQESFEMIYDSRPLAKSVHLTSRVQKESTGLNSKNDEIKDGLEFFKFVDSIMNSDEDTVHLDDDGRPIDPFESYFSARRDYYNVVQDFGFKANLFGVNISVFPMYQYGDDIMAKSFNVNELYEFLLSVRVQNNTQIGDFVRNVQVYDSIIKIVPLEYTLVSKRSAVDENYEHRLPKDVADIEYITRHKEELGITDESVEQISANYPDYSVSIAYKVDGTKTKTKTMDGESYKEYVLINKGTRNVS